jgi:hypothetical protein
MTPVPIQFKGGLNRSHTSTQSDSSSLYTLAGFRQSQTTPGELEQVPYFVVASQKSRGTYYNAGSQTEPVTSSVVAQLVDLVSASGTLTLTDYVAWEAFGTQVQCFYQTTVPSANTINTQCYIVINSVASLAITLGSTLDVVIDAATTFKWRKNGGGYTAGLACSTTGTSIDGGNATVYFMASSGFTVNDTWTWTRTDRVGEASTSTLATPLNFKYFRSSIFYIANTSRLMFVNKAGATETYIISAGYRPIYGRGLEIFYDHLVVTSYATTSTLALTSKVIANSDSLDIQVFFSTDVNEADTFTPPNSSAITLIGPLVYNKTLFIFTNGTIYYTPYLGLPIVFNYDPFIEFAAGTSDQSSLYTGHKFIATGSSKGVYLIARGLIWLFDGSNFTEISQPLNGLGIVPYSVHYVGTTFEVWVRDGNNKIWIYQERLGTWYQRFASFDSIVTSFGSVNNDGSIGVGSRYTLGQDAFFQTPVFDGSQGTTFQTPTIITHLLTGGEFSSMKEVSGTYLVAVSTTAGSDYSTTTNCVVKLSWYLADAGVISGSATTDSNATWTNNQTNGMISYPRASFRALALQITLVGLVTNKPPGSVHILGLEPQMTSWPKPKATR